MVITNIREWFNAVFRDVKMYKLNVREKYYNMLKSGVKKIELRLFDDKRKNIKIGDMIEFANVSDTKDTFAAQVIDLHRADDFAALCRIIDCRDAGFETDIELVAALQEFYPPEQQKKYGVVGIEIDKI